MDQRCVEQVWTDVVVIGGGAAGVAAAVTVARKGIRVTLVERYGFCGGGAVAGLSGTICGLYEAIGDLDRTPRQIVFGFAQEFVTALDRQGGLTPPVPYGKTWTRVHDPLAWRDTADALLRDAGVQVIYHAVATGVHLQGGERVEGVMLWTKQGPVDLRARIVIDASGDADVVAMADLPSFVGDAGRVQNPTMIFRLLGVDTERFRTAYGRDTIMPAAVTDMIEEARSSGRYQLPRTKIWLFATPRPGELLCNCTRILGPDGRELNTLFWRDFSDAEIEGRRQAREYARFIRDHLAGCERAFVNDTGVQVGVRQTRQLEGKAKLRTADVLAARKFADGIARSTWPIELHSGAKPRVEWLIDDFYEVPFDCFVPVRGQGLLVTGRCLSADHEAVASARVTAQCFSYGQAVGLAAAHALREGIEARDIDGIHVRRLLNRDGARLD